MQRHSEVSLPCEFFMISSGLLGVIVGRLIPAPAPTELVPACAGAFTPPVIDLTPPGMTAPAAPGVTAPGMADPGVTTPDVSAPGVTGCETLAVRFGGGEGAAIGVDVCFLLHPPAKHMPAANQAIDRKFVVRNGDLAFGS